MKIFSALKRLPDTLKGSGGLGIDIGTSAVKIIELKGSGENLEVVNYGELSGAEALVVMHSPEAGRDAERLDQDVADLVSDLLLEMGVKQRRAALSIPAHATLFNLLEFPQMQGKELHDAVLFQAERLISVPLAEVVLDWDVVGEREGTDERPAMVYVLTAAVPREVVDRYVRIGKRAGLSLSGLESEPFSLVRAASRIASGTYAILDFGSLRSSLVIAEGGSVRTVHDIELTGATLTNALAKSLIVEEERAEEMKRAHGLLVEGGADLKRTLSPFIDGMLAEMRSVFSEYVRKHDHTVETLYLTGGSSQIKGFVEHASGQFKTTIALLTSLHGMRLPDTLAAQSKVIEQSFAVAIGLALRHNAPLHEREG